MSGRAVFGQSPPKPFIAVVGADGFVGGGLAAALRAKRVVYGPCRDGEVHINQAEALLNKADVIINAGGFRVRPGCTYADYQRSHQGATSALVPAIRKGALLVHLSSASVLGKSPQQRLGNQTPADPGSFPSPAYARAKIEADQFLQRAAAERDFGVVLLRPAVVYAPHGAGMIDTLLRLAMRGIHLRLYPRGARHHLCHMRLLVEVTRRVIERGDGLHSRCLVVADPYTVTSRELETMIARYAPTRATPVPMPVRGMSTLLRHSFHSRHAKLDWATWGEILGVLHLDTVYDPSDTFRALQIDPAQYSLANTLQPLIQEAFQQRSPRG